VETLLMMSALIMPGSFPSVSGSVLRANHRGETRNCQGKTQAISLRMGRLRPGAEPSDPRVLDSTGQPPMSTARRNPRPIVALLGVPNVGKSTLFNRLLGERRALVADQPGTTRDRIYAPWRASGKTCLLCDTGGFVGPGAEGLQEEIERQTFIAVEEADVIVLVVDGRAGVTAGDRDLAVRLRSASDRVLLAWNKADDPRLAQQATEGFELGLGEPIPVSAEHGLGIADLIDAISGRIPEETSGLPASPGERIRVAIVGRPNVGKSSLLNRLCGADRVTVAAEPGTTRDTVDTEVIRRGRLYRFVDTAGIRRPSRAVGRVETLGVLMAKRAVSRAELQSPPPAQPQRRKRMLRSAVFRQRQQQSL